MSLLTGLASAALTLIAIPEAVLRSVIALALAFFSVLTGFESPMPGNSNFDKIIVPYAFPLFMAAKGLGLDID